LQMLQCLEHRLPARHGTKTNATGEVRQKTADSFLHGCCYYPKRCNV
jgi:hypothetical protein